MSSGPIWPKWNHENEKIVLFAASLPENDQNIMKTPSFEYITDTKEKLRMEPLYQWFHTEMVREMGLEPTRHNHTHLKRACLPFQHSREHAKVL